MTYTFNGATAFNQALGWCVDDAVYFATADTTGATFSDAFLNAPCASSSCGVVQQSPSCTITDAMTDSTIGNAVLDWFADPTAAKSTYGHISTWDTSGVTNMKDLFCADSTCPCAATTVGAAAMSFNEDISAWDTSGVTSMDQMFYSASAFNQDIGGWNVDKVTSMVFMFEGATAFDQDLSWCVAFLTPSVFDPLGHGYTIQDAFSGTQCNSTSSSTQCGVKQSSACSGVTRPRPSPSPTPARCLIDSWEAEKVISSAANGAIAIYALDVDGDGDVDVLAGGDKAWWYRNDGQSPPGFDEAEIKEGGGIESDAFLR